MKKPLASLLLAAFLLVSGSAYAQATGSSGQDKDKKEDTGKDKDKKDKKKHKGGKKGKKGKKGTSGGATTPPK